MDEDFKPFLSGGPLKKLLLIVVSLVAVLMACSVEQRSLAWHYEYAQVSLHEPARALFTLAEAERRQAQSGTPGWLLVPCSLCSKARAEQAFADLLDEGQRYRGAGFHKKWGRSEVADTKAARLVVLAGWGDHARLEELKSEFASGRIADFAVERAGELVEGRDAPEQARLRRARTWGFGSWSRLGLMLCAVATAVAFALGFRYPRRAARCRLAAPDLWRGLLIFVWELGFHAALALLRWDDPDGVLSVFSQVPGFLPALTVLALLLSTARRRAETPVASLMTCPPDRRSRRVLVLLALAATGSQFLFWRLGGALLGPLGFGPRWVDAVRESLMFGTSGEAVAACVSAIVFAPLGEELLFRGVLFGALLPKLGVHRAALVSAALFALIHGYGLLGSVDLFVAGYIWARLDARAGTLVPSMLSHSLVNFVIDVTRLLAR